MRLKSSFFWRLLTAFILCGVLPLFLLSVVFTAASAYTIEKNSKKQSEEVLNKSIGIIEQVFQQAQSITESLANDESALQWCLGFSSTIEKSIAISDIFQKINAFGDNKTFQVFILKADSEDVLTRGTVPEEYKLATYNQWGLRHVLKTKYVINPVYFSQPHPFSGANAVAALACPIYNNDATPAGFVVVDILREGFSEKISDIENIQRTLNDFSIIDDKNCILYSHFNSETESHFFDTEKNNEQISGLFLPFTALFIHSERPAMVSGEFIKDLRTMAIIIAIISGALSTVIAMLVSRSIAKPIQQLVQTMQQAESGNLTVQCPEPQYAAKHDDMVYLIRHFNQMVNRIHKLFNDTVTQQKLLRSAEVKALQAQISPHFLYNTLNSIKSMAKLAGEKNIASMVTNLGKLLRTGFTPGEDFSTIEQAMELVHGYFEIEASRWENRFTLEENIDPRLMDYPLPRLLIQPIVENALVHGLEEKKGHGTLSIKGYIAPSLDTNLSEDICIEITDDGTGISEHRLRAIRSALTEKTDSIQQEQIGSNGIALINTHQRLQLLYGSSYGLNISSEENRGTTVTFRVPYKRGSHD